MRRAGRLIFAALLAVQASSVFAGGCRTDAAFLKGSWGEAWFSVELADDAEERARGLMFRDSLPGGAGMLFVYPHPQQVAFWMRNTLIPLDMVFMDATGTVTHIHENAVPGDETPIPGGTAVRFVLEINAGLARRLGLNIGTVMKHPSVDQALAAWGC